MSFRIEKEKRAVCFLFFFFFLFSFLCLRSTTCNVYTIRKRRRGQRRHLFFFLFSCVWWTGRQWQRQRRLAVVVSTDIVHHAVLFYLSLPHARPSTRPPTRQSISGAHLINQTATRGLKTMIFLSQRLFFSLRLGRFQKEIQTSQMRARSYFKILFPLGPRSDQTIWWRRSQSAFSLRCRSKWSSHSATNTKSGQDHTFSLGLLIVRLVHSTIDLNSERAGNN